MFSIPQTLIFLSTSKRPRCTAEEYESQFMKDKTSIGNYTSHQHDYQHRKFRSCFSETLPHHYEILSMGKGEIEKLLAAKVICSSRLSLSAPIIVVPKGDGGKCLVINYRTLNKVTKKFTWAHAKGRGHILQINGATNFTTLDLRADYHHTPLDRPSIPKVASNSPSGNTNMSRFHLD